MIDPNSKLSASDDVVSRKVAGEVVLLDLVTGTYFGLNGVGGRAWELMEDKPLTTTELCAAIEAEFDAPRPTIERDIAELAERLSEQNLISVAA